MQSGLSEQEQDCNSGEKDPLSGSDCTGYWGEGEGAGQDLLAVSFILSSSYLGGVLERGRRCDFLALIFYPGETCLKVAQHGGWVTWVSPQRWLRRRGSFARVASSLSLPCSRCRRPCGRKETWTRALLRYLTSERAACICVGLLPRGCVGVCPRGTLRFHPGDS